MVVAIHLWPPVCELNMVLQVEPLTHLGTSSMMSGGGAADKVSTIFSSCLCCSFLNSAKSPQNGLWVLVRVTDIPYPRKSCADLLSF